MSPLSPHDDSFLSHSHSRRTRTSQSCRECSRRKIKCDRNLPCKPCVERGEADLCRKRLLGPPQSRAARLAQQQQQAALNSTSPPDGSVAIAGGHAAAQQAAINATLQEELRQIRGRLSQLEATVARTNSSSNSNNDHRDQDDTKNDRSGASVITSRSTKSTTPDYESALANHPSADGIEEAALGIGNHKRRLGLAVLRDTCGSFEEEQPWFQPIPFAQCVISLPPRQISDALVAYYFDQLSWCCGNLHRSTFYEQQEAFWAEYQMGQPLDDSWLSVLFAVLSTSVFYLEEEDMERLRMEVGFIPEEQHQRGSLWFDCSIASVFRCQGLARPSLSSCQAIIVLHSAFHLSGKSRIHNSMTVLVVNMTRAMNLHLLGEGNKGVTSREELVRREMGRRAWWWTVDAEWYFLPYVRYCSIAPHQFDTSLPDLTDNNTLASSLPSSTPHSLSYFLACCHSSRILYDLYGTLRHDQKPSYDAVFAASHRLDSIVQNLPPDLQAPTSPDKTNPFPPSSGLPGLQVPTFLNMLLAYRSYIIHRAYFWRALQRGSIYQHTRTACVKAAETILNLAELNYLPSRYYRLWTTTLYLTAAGIVLALDLAFDWNNGRRRSEDERERTYARLDKLRVFLETEADLSGIATRGALTINHLCTVGKGGEDAVRKLSAGQDPTSSDYQSDGMEGSRSKGVSGEAKNGNSKLSVLHIEELLQNDHGYNNDATGERVNDELKQSGLHRGRYLAQQTGSMGMNGNMPQQPHHGHNGLHQHLHEQQQQQQQNGVHGQGIELTSKPVAGIHDIEQYAATNQPPLPLADEAMLEMGTDWLADFNNQWMLTGGAAGAGGGPMGLSGVGVTQRNGIHGGDGVGGGGFGAMTHVTGATASHGSPGQGLPVNEYGSASRSGFGH